MRRRLRKKKRLGEFVEFGFRVQGRGLASRAVADVFCDELINFVESRGMFIGGRVSSNSVDFFVTRQGSCTEDDRAAMQTWLGEQYLVNRLVDANGDWDAATGVRVR